MGRKRYNDDALRAKALELRREGLSYREIAGRLGCSVYKVWELLSPHENLQSRIRQAAELAQKLDELGKRVSKVEEKISRIEGLESLAVLASRIEELEKRVNRINRDFGIASLSAFYKVFDNPCRWIDDRGFCRLLHFGEDDVREYQDVERVVVNGRVVYRLNVEIYPWLCLGCPFYQPRRV